MEAHPEVSLCYHNALVYDVGRDGVSLCIYDQKTGYISDRDIICTTHGWYPTASLFRRASYLLEQSDLLPATGDDSLKWRLMTYILWNQDKVLDSLAGKCVGKDIILYGRDQSEGGGRDHHSHNGLLDAQA